MCAELYRVLDATSNAHERRADLTCTNIPSEAHPHTERGSTVTVDGHNVQATHALPLRPQRTHYATEDFLDQEHTESAEL